MSRTVFFIARSSEVRALGGMSPYFITDRKPATTRKKSTRPRGRLRMRERSTTTTWGAVRAGGFTTRPLPEGKRACRDAADAHGAPRCRRRPLVAIRRTRRYKQEGVARSTIVTSSPARPRRERYGFPEPGL